MSDSPAIGSEMPFSRAILVVFVIGLTLVTAGVVFGLGNLPEQSGSGPPINATGLDTLQTQEPRCGTHRSSNSSTAVHPGNGGAQISINQTVPVAARDSELTADFRRVDDRRYLLDLQRTAGNRSTECYLEMRFTATVNTTQRDDYTLIVAVDGTRIQRLVSRPGGSGAGSSNLDPRPPSMNDSEWEATLNASDDYFYNETGERPAESDSDGTDRDDSATNGENSDESGGPSSSGGESTGSAAN